MERNKKQVKSEIESKIRTIDSFRKEHQLLLIDFQAIVNDMESKLEVLSLDDKVGNTDVKYVIKFLNNEGITTDDLINYIDYVEEYSYSGNEQKEMIKRCKKTKR